MRVALVRRPIELAALLAEVSRDVNGASAAFVGTVRSFNEGRPVTGIEYSAYEAMAEREMLRIVSEVAEKFRLPDIIAEHRLGALSIGEVSFAVVAAHPRRAQALDGLRYAVEEIKRRVPIWKLEQYVDGSREWVDPSRGHAA